jgi:phosphatidylglycerol---prolipoprotein diacylglyceryl transferase
MFDPYGIHFGSLLYVRYYGIIIMSGVVVAAIMSARRAKQYGMDPETVWDMVTWAVIGGVIGARIWHILTPSPALVEQGITTMYYLTHPLEALAIWNGGLGIVGAVIGGALTVFIYLRFKKQSFLTWVDIIAPGLILAQAIGRWGNFINEELYGAPTNLPWALYIDPAHRLPQFADIAYYHPTFFYESLLNLIGMGLMIWLSMRYFEKLKPGDIFLVYLIYYPIVRILMEMLRLDSSTVAGFNINQALMVPVFVLAAATLAYRHLRPSRGAPAAETSELENGQG